MNVAARGWAQGISRDVHAGESLDILAMLGEIEAEGSEQELGVRPVETGLCLEPGDLLIRRRREGTLAGQIILDAGLKDAPSEVFLVVRDVFVELPLDDDRAMFDQVLAHIRIGNDYRDAERGEAVRVAYP